MHIPARAAAPPDSKPKCGLTEYASLNVLWSVRPPAFSAPMIPVELDDNSAKMTFDSAGAFTLLREDVSDQLKLRAKSLPHPLEFGTVSLSRYVTVPRFKLGHLVLENVDMVLVPRNDRSIGDTTAGILAMGELANIDVELDLGHDKINLFSPDNHCPEAPVYWADTYAVTSMSRGHLDEPYVVMELEGKKLQTMLSTRATVSTLSSTVSRKLYGFDENSPGLTTLRYGDGSSVRRYKAMALTANGLKISNADIAVDPGSGCSKGAALSKDRDGAIGFDGCFGTHPLRLGIGILKQLRLYVSAKDHKLYFTSWDARRGDVPAAWEPKTAEDFSKRAKAYMTQGHLAQAAADLTRATELNPGEPRYFYQRAIVYEYAQERLPAIRDLDQALKLNPDFVEAHLARATLELLNKNTTAARGDFDAAVRSTPKESDIHLAIGNGYLAAGAPAQAIEEFDTWITAHPNGASLAAALNGRCWARALWGQELDKAETDCNAALRLRPGTLSYLDSRGWVYFRRGEFERSIDDFNTALGKQPALVSSLYGRGLDELRLARKAAARADMTKAAALQPNVSEQFEMYGIKP